MGGSRSHSENKIRKSSTNSPILILIFCGGIPCVFCLYTLLKVVSHYDLKVLSMSVTGFNKKNWIWGWVGLSSIHLVEDFGIFNFAHPLCVTSNYGSESHLQGSNTWKTVTIDHRSESKFARLQCFLPLGFTSQNLHPNKVIPRMLEKQ